MRFNEYITEKSKTGKWYLENDDEKRIAGPFNTEQEAKTENMKRVKKNTKRGFVGYNVVQE